MNRNSKLVLSLFLVLALATLTIWMNCEKSVKSPVAPITHEEPIALSKADPQVRSVMAIQERHTPDLMANSEVAGTAVTVTEDGKPAIMVMTKTQTLKKGQGIPEMIEGIPVIIEVTGVIRPMKGKPGGGGGGKVSHTAKQTPPIQLGTSGGWRYDLANGYCCGGTLGSLVTKGGKQYIMSNYHVFEADIVSGGNSRVAQNGDYVIQPGLIDVGCSAANAQNVGTLVLQHSLPDHNVDVSLAEVISGMVRTDGAILEIGTISASTVVASINQAVKKSGRTTGLTRSTVSGLNATVSVAYENECAGGSSFTKTFTGQIIISNRGSKFLNSGDSGSLMVEDVSTNPRAVGLLFAGSSSLAVANPINEVLSFLGASMVGQ
jgi:hypothetical protein